MANRWRLMFILSPLACWLTGCAAPPEVRPVLNAAGGIVTERVSVAYDSGKKAFAAGDYAKAASDFATAVRLAEYDVAALNGLAASYDQLGRFDLADRLYEQSLMLRPGDPDSLNNLGYSLLLRGHASEAAFILERALEAAPNDRIVSGNLCRAKSLMARPQRGGVKPSQPGPINPRLERAGAGLYQWSDTAAGTFPVSLVPARQDLTAAMPRQAPDTVEPCPASPRQSSGSRTPRPTDER